jgi:hypothetical protein
VGKQSPRRRDSCSNSAAFALTLASNEHPFMTGAKMVLDGGKTAKAG